MAEFFGVDPSTWDDDRLLAYIVHIPRLEARRRRRELALRPDIKLNVEGVYEMVLAETEDEQQAQAAATEYWAALLRRGETPG